MHLLSVGGAAVAVTGRDLQQLAVAPLASAAVPRLERRRCHADDARHEVAASRREVRSRRVLGAGGDERATVAVGACLRGRRGDPAPHDLDPAVEPRSELGEVAVAPEVDDAVAREAVYEVGPHHPERRIARPRRQAEHGRLHRVVLQRIVGGRLLAPEVELPQLLVAGLSDDREVDPASQPHVEPPRVRRFVEAVVRVARGAVAEEREVPVGCLREHALLLGHEVGADAGEVRGLGLAQLGVCVACSGEERVANSRPVDGIARPLTTEDGLCQSARAHRVGAAEQERRDLRCRIGSAPRLHPRGGYGLHSRARRLAGSSRGSVHAHRDRVGPRRLSSEAAPRIDVLQRRWTRGERPGHRLRGAGRLPADLRRRRARGRRRPRRARHRARRKRPGRADLGQQGAGRARRALQRPLHRGVLAAPQRRQRVVDRRADRGRGTRRRDPARVAHHRVRRRAPPAADRRDHRNWRPQ